MRTDDTHEDSPAIANAARTLRVAAVGDLHCKAQSTIDMERALEPASNADVLLLCGDLTDHGLPDEAHVLAKGLAKLPIPVLAVFGNHDFESGNEGEITRILSEAGVTMLDGDVCEIGGVGFAGVRGFGGGFGRLALGFWGEPATKAFVQETLGEALKLESALARLQVSELVVAMHYSPVPDTLTGEPLEIYPFLGSSRLEEPINRYCVRAVFHGHAHEGQPEGRTSTGIAVYNVAAPVLRRCHPERAPIRIVEISASGEIAAPAGEP